VHPTSPLEQPRSVNFPVINESMCVAVGRHELRALTNQLTNLSPRAPLSMKQRNAAMSQCVRSEVRNASGPTRSPDCHAQPVSGDAIEEGSGGNASRT
jgi:hypothetical protein